MTSEYKTEMDREGKRPEGRTVGDASKPGGPSVADMRRSYVEEQYPAFVRNNRPRPSDLKRMRDEASALGYRPLFSVVMPVLDARRERLGRSFDSVVRQAYPGWELLCVYGEGADGGIEDLLSRYERLDGRVKVSRSGHDGEGGGEAGLLNAALSLAGGEFVWVLGEGDELAPDALFEVAKVLQDRPGVDLLYADEDAIDERGVRTEPRFKPGFSPDLLLSTDYIGRAGVWRRSLAQELGGYREDLEGAHVHDLLLRLTERAREIVHVPKVLYHGHDERADGADGAGVGAREKIREAISEALERRGIGGTVEDGLIPGTFRARPKIEGHPLVSIVIPSRDNVAMLKNCVQSIERLTEYPHYEILIVDNDSKDPATLEYLEKTPHRVIPFEEEFNYSKINNFAASRADGEYVLLLNDDTEVVDGGWLSAMLEHAHRPEVGAVGAKLLYPDGRVQHAGVVTGVGGLGPGVSAHCYQFYAPDDPGHLGTLSTTTNYSAVTAACVLLPKAVYEEVGGLDQENLRVSFNDVDLCLRIRERGYLVVYTPHAQLLHHESISRGRKDNPAEGLYMMKRWERELDADPYYNPNFSRGGADFNLRADLLRPRALGRRVSDDPESSFDGLVPTSSEERERFTRILQGALTASREERKQLMETHQRVARDSYRTALIPVREARNERMAALEGFGQHEGPVPPADE